MKKTFKMLTAAFLAVVGGVSFAQTLPQSMTSKSTMGLFGTDVDNFISVISWNTVKPENLFGYLGYGEDGIGSYEIGAAKTVKNKYFAAFMTGRFDGASSTTTTTTTTTETGTKTKSLINGNYTVAGFYGSGNLGVLAGFAKKTTTDSKSTNTTAAATTTTTTKIYNFIPFVEVGYKTKFQKYNVTPYAGLTLDVNKNKVKTVTGSTETTNDSSNKSLVLFAGSGIDLGKKGIFQQNADVNVAFAKTFVNHMTGATKYYGDSAFAMTVTPSYTATAYAADNLTLKANVVAPVAFGHTATYDYYEYNGTKTYNGSRVTANSFTCIPTINVASQLVIKPNKFLFNTGLNFTVPEMSATIKTTKTRNTTDGTVASTTRDRDYAFESHYSDGDFTVSDGFTWIITPNVTLDITSNIIGSLTTSFKTTLNEGSGADILGTLNQVFVHNIAFSVQCKF